MAPQSSDAQALASINGETAVAKKRFWALTFGSIGVVYGDIGTSPLYALREAVLAASEHGPVTPDAVLGMLSLIFWSLIVVVTLMNLTAVTVRNHLRKKYAQSAV